MDSDKSLVRVSDLLYPTVSDTSDAVFSIFHYPSGDCLGDIDSNGQRDLRDLDTMVNLCVDAGMRFIMPPSEQTH